MDGEYIRAVPTNVCAHLQLAIIIDIIIAISVFWLKTLLWSYSKCIEELVCLVFIVECEFLIYKDIFHLQNTISSLEASSDK